MTSDDNVDLGKYRVPTFCPTCKRMMKGSKCNSTYYQYNCCYDCYIQWVEDREQKWLAGWRPSDEEMQKFLKQFDPIYEF